MWSCVQEKLLACSAFREPRLSSFFPYTTLFRSGTRIGNLRQIDARKFVGQRPPLGGEWAKSPGIHSPPSGGRSEEHTSELQSRVDFVCRLLLEKKNHRSVPRSRPRSRGRSLW